MRHDIYTEAYFINYFKWSKKRPHKLYVKGDIIKLFMIITYVLILEYKHGLETYKEETNSDKLRLI